MLDGVLTTKMYPLNIYYINIQKQSKELQNGQIGQIGVQLK